ncbi:S-antigen protein-like [Anomalospiza imberbis]|uniref:S-antigen protein-like n=1 Tax=Anomalospiza imberbis TaxID=187417 RepID=UPI00358EFDE9
MAALDRVRAGGRSLDRRLDAVPGQALLAGLRAAGAVSEPEVAALGPPDSSGWARRLRALAVAKGDRTCHVLLTVLEGLEGPPRPGPFDFYNPERDAAPAHRSDCPCCRPEPEWTREEEEGAPGNPDEGPEEEEEEGDAKNGDEGPEDEEGDAKNGDEGPEDEEDGDAKNGDEGPEDEEGDAKNGDEGPREEEDGGDEGPEDDEGGAGDEGPEDDEGGAGDEGPEDDEGGAGDEGPEDEDGGGDED